MLHFLGIGAQKAGTTWTYEQLHKHPQIFFPPHKEIHFWDLHRERGIDWYMSLFPDYPDDRIKNGEITPAYSFLPLDIITQIALHFPDIRLFYILRHPIDRAWSGALMALRKAELLFEEASDQWFIDHFKSKGSLKRGNYKACIDNWLTAYPQEQLLILNFADIAANPRGFLTTLSTHLGIDPDFFDTLTDQELSTKIYAGNGESIRPSLRPILEDMYRDKIDFYEQIVCS